MILNNNKNHQYNSKTYNLKEHNFKKKIISKKIYNRYNKFKSKKMMRGGRPESETSLPIDPKKIKIIQGHLKMNCDFYKLKEIPKYPTNKFLNDIIKNLEIKKGYSKIYENYVVNSGLDKELPISELQKKFNAVKTSIDNEDKSGFAILNSHAHVKQDTQIITIPPNMILCYLAPFGKLGIGNLEFSKFFQNDIKSNRNFLRTLLTQRVHLTDRFNRDTGIIDDEDLFDNSVWYYPGQQVYNSECSIYINDLTEFEKNNVFRSFHFYTLEKGKDPEKISFPIYNKQTLKRELETPTGYTFTLNGFINDIKNNLENTVYKCKNILVILKFCNTFQYFNNGRVTDFNRAAMPIMKDRIIPTIQYESFMYHLNKYVIDPQPNKKLTDFPNIKGRTESGYIYVPLNVFKIRDTNFNPEYENVKYQPFSRRLPKIKRMYEEIFNEYFKDNCDVDNLDKSIINYLSNLSFIKKILLFYKLFHEFNYLDVEKEIKKFMEMNIEDLKQPQMNELIKLEKRRMFIVNLYEITKESNVKQIYNSFNYVKSSNNKTYYLKSYYNLIFGLKYFSLMKTYNFDILKILEVPKIGLYTYNANYMLHPLKVLISNDVIDTIKEVELNDIVVDIKYNQKILSIIFNNVDFTINEHLKNFLGDPPGKQYPILKEIIFNECKINEIKFNKNEFPCLEKICVYNSHINKLNIDSLKLKQLHLWGGISGKDFKNTKIHNLEINENEDLKIILNSQCMIYDVNEPHLFDTLEIISFNSRKLIALQETDGNSHYEISLDDFNNSKFKMKNLILKKIQTDDFKFINNDIKSLILENCKPHIIQSFFKFLTKTKGMVMKNIVNKFYNLERFGIISPNLNNISSDITYSLENKYLCYLLDSRNPHNLKYIEIDMKVEDISKSQLKKLKHCDLSNLYLIIDNGDSTIPKIVNLSNTNNLKLNEDISI